MSELQLVQLRKAAELTTAAEAVRARVLAGDATADLDALVKLEGEARRAVRALNINTHARPRCLTCRPTSPPKPRSGHLCPMTARLRLRHDQATPHRARHHLRGHRRHAPLRALAEYMAEFRSDLEAFVSREVVEACVPPGVYERAPVPGITYRAFVDPAGGSGEDSMTLAIAHRDGDRVILDALRERQPRPRFSPDHVVEEFAATLKAYGISSVRGDQYGGDWPAERFRAHGIAYEKAGKVKSDIYRDVLPLLNAGRVELLDHPRLVAQLCSLERRTARGGRDSIDHAPGAHDDLINSVSGALIELSPTGADAWITYVKAEAARATEAPVQQYDDDRSRFYLPNNSKRNDPPSTTNKRAMHPLQPTALIGNPYSDAYFGAISAAENRPVAMATPRCSHCGAETVGTRLSDGVRSWCHVGCQQNWIKARVEKNRARACR